ncbi:MFS family permease [Salirhabdus euzebyi]|uniref:MFS family permease n=1 Tax=Salirhabdus euzebyi TaxID=394506 RepID=A0A841Q4S9_9BACI|nr:MFS transporter [Salirhabdus euzebyi]MBB6453363.1 MFS family permease [Salirhabdus euzebyi]
MNKFEILKNKNFLLLWLGQSVSTLGSRFYMIAIMWYVIEKTGSSMNLGLTVLCFTLPAVLIMPLAGIIADHNYKKTILITSDLINGVLVSVMAIFMYYQALPSLVLYTIIITVSASSAFFSPAISASIPLIAGKEQLSKANSLNQFTNRMSNIVGPAMAGVLIAVTDIWLLLLLNGLSFIISAISECFIKIPDVEVSKDKKKFKEQFFEGLQYVRKVKELMALIFVGGVIINFFLAPLTVFITVICNQILEVGSEGFGLVEACISVGALVGSVFSFFNIIKNQIKLGIIGLVLEGVALLVGGIFLSFPSMIIFAILLGLGVSMASIGITTMLQLLVPENMMGRVGSILSSLSTITVPIGILVGSYVINVYSIELIFIVSGVIVLLSGLTLVVPFASEFKRKPEVAVEI